MNKTSTKNSASDESMRSKKIPARTDHANPSIDEIIDSIREKIQLTLQKKAKNPNRYDF